MSCIKNVLITKKRPKEFKDNNRKRQHFTPNLKLISKDLYFCETWTVILRRSNLNTMFQSNIPFSDILIYKQNNNTLRTTLYQHSISHQLHFHVISRHLFIPVASSWIQTIWSHLQKKTYINELRFKTISSYSLKHCEIKTQKFKERGSKKSTLKIINYLMEYSLYKFKYV